MLPALKKPLVAQEKRFARTLNIGLIGCGEYSQRTHYKVLAASPEVQIAGISNCPLTGDSAGQKIPPAIDKVYENHRDMFRSLDLDAVVISTPHTQHFAQAMDALEAGLHVLVDKPPACTAADAAALAAAAAQRGLLCLVACQRRYDPFLRDVLKAATEGGLGKLRHLEFRYCRSRRTDFRAGWRNDSHLSGGGVLLDAGYHLLDTLVTVTGLRPEKIQGTLTCRDAAVETFVALSLTFPSGLTATVTIHLDLPAGCVQEEMAFYGTTRALLWQRYSHHGIVTRQLISIPDRESQWADLPENGELDQAPAINFVRALTLGEPVISPIVDSISTIELIDAIYAAIPIVK
jgi:predicted dehydrogenase